MFIRGSNMKFKTNLRLKSNIIDPVPFVDAMVLFIVFFLLAGQLAGKTGVVLDLPKIEQSELYKADSIVVSLVDEKIFLNEKEVVLDKLQEELSSRKSQLLAIKADSGISHSRVTEIIAIARRAGIEKIAIATEGVEK